MEIKNRQKLLVVLAGVSVGLLLLNSIVVGPLTQMWQRRADHIKELKKSISEGAQLIDRGPIIADSWDRKKTNTLPVNVSMAEGELYKAVYKWASDSGVSVGSIRSQWKESGEDYMTLECRADASGDIRRVANFLYNLEKDPMGVKVESVEISAHDNDGRQLSLGLQLSGLVLSPTEQ